MIRKATINDLPKLAPIASEFYQASRLLGTFEMSRFIVLWTQLLGNGTGAVFLLEDDAEIVGALGGVAYPDIYSSELIAMEFFWYVRPDSRGGGGMRLYREFEAWAEFMECSQIRMAHLTHSMPEKLERLYQRLGYVKAETHYMKAVKEKREAA